MNRVLIQLLVTPMLTPKTKLQAGKPHLLCCLSTRAGDGFYDEHCFDIYRRHLFNCLTAYQNKLHAYVLLNNCIYLLVTPLTATSARNLLRSINRSYSVYFNNRFNRSGKVWSETVFAAPIREGLALDCQKYIERLPRTMGRVPRLGTYQWSSYCGYAYGCRSEFLVPLVAYRALRRSQAASLVYYREYIDAPFSDAYSVYLDEEFSISTKRL